MVDTKNIRRAAKVNSGDVQLDGKMNHIVKTIYIYSNDITTPIKREMHGGISKQTASVHAGTMRRMVHLDGIFEGDCATSADG